MIDHLIRGGFVVTLDPSYRVFPEGTVAVQGRDIVAIGPQAEVEKQYPPQQARQVIEAGGKLVMPGFICTHTHMPSVLGHNMPVDFSQFHEFMDLLTKWWWPQIEDQTTAEDIYWATLYASVKMLKTGTTCVGEMVEAPMALPGCLDASIKAADEVGIRAMISYEATDRVNVENGRLGVQENLRVVKELGTGGRLRGRFACHTADTCSADMLREVRRLASETGAGIFIHVAEIPPALTVEKLGKTAPRVLEDLGFLGPDVLAVHCIHLTDEELDILARHDVKIAHTPMSNMLGGNGVARVPDMLKRGMTVSLGHDCFFTLDIFEYLRAAYLVHKVHRLNPNVMIPPQALDLVTRGAAQALSLEGEIGTLEVGKRADVLVVDPRAPAPLLPETWLPYIISDVNGADVRTVVVDGRVVVKDRQVLTVDEEEVRARCVERARLLWQRAGAIA